MKIKALVLIICAVPFWACSKSGTAASQSGSISGLENYSEKTSLRVGTYNIWESVARSSTIASSSDVSSQRYYLNSEVALASIIKDMDCDVLALQELGDSTLGRYTNPGLPTVLKNLGADYSWCVISNVSKSNRDGKCSYAPGIIWKTSVLALEDSGIIWLSGDYTSPTLSESLEYGNVRACDWALFRHIASGKKFYFFSAHLDITSFRASAIKTVTSADSRNLNAAQLIAYAEENVPEYLPSIIAGDMNTNTGTTTYSTLTSGRWTNARDIAEEKAVLAESESESTGTMNEKNESALSKARYDHIFLDGFAVQSYSVNRGKYSTADGTAHYPSDHFPVTVDLMF